MIIYYCPNRLESLDDPSFLEHKKGTIEHSHAFVKNLGDLNSSFSNKNRRKYRLFSTSSFESVITIDRKGYLTFY